MADPKKEINLLPIEEFEKTRLGRLLRWALTVGRWIVITTELIVILCFLSRFKLDRDLTDLGEKIKQQQAIITSFESLENDFRNLQKRLTTITQLNKEQILITSLLNGISQTVPLDVSLKELAITEKEVQIAGLALSEAGLNSFVQKLSESQFKNINLENITKERTGEIKFRLAVQTP